MKAIGKIKSIVGLPFNVVRSIVGSKPRVMTDLRTVEYIIEKKCSIARFGDGELDLMNGIGIKFQKADKNLRKRLIQVAESDDPDILICVPDIFGSRNELYGKLVRPAAKWWRKHLLFMRGKWYKHFGCKNRVLGDTQISRFYVDVNDKKRTADYVVRLRSIWQDADIVFVEGKNSRLGVGNDLFDNARSVKRIICPPENAFDRYAEILSKTMELTSENDLIICALGPTATVLSYDLAHTGRRCLDLGHVDIEYEWYLMGVNEKVGIAGKETYEATDVIETCDNAEIGGIIYEFD